MDTLPAQPVRALGLSSRLAVQLAVQSGCSAALPDAGSGKEISSQYALKVELLGA